MVRVLIAAAALGSLFVADHVMPPAIEAAAWMNGLRHTLGGLAAAVFFAECWRYFFSGAWRATPASVRAVTLFGAAMTAGVAWELYEFWIYADRVFTRGTGFLWWRDTLVDFCYDALGAAIGAFWRARR